LLAPTSALAVASVPSLARAETAIPVQASYEKNRLTVETDDGNYRLRLQNRLQFRYAYPFDPDPRSLEDLNQDLSSFMVRRARFKLEGHAFRPWLMWNFQYDWSQPVLRDFSFDIAKFDWLRFRIGRRKVLWNDERVTSSGRQQFVNRSILNDLFTVDRQQGIQVFGRLFPETWADLSYYAGVFTGLGVGSRENDDQHMMYSGRLQWNVFGRELDFSQSDVEFHQQPAANIAGGVAHNISRCTAFETDARSCRALPTPRSDGSAFVEPGVAEAGRYEVDQAFFEFRIKWRGWYAKHEQHFKRVIDRQVPEGAPGRQTDLQGTLYQLGYFPHYALPIVPRPLELAARYAWVNPAAHVSHDHQTELSGVANWFFSGHANKVSVELSRLTVADPSTRVTEARSRVRVQWDVSF
jgi:phosphate-selective porin OprO/OprP